MAATNGIPSTPEAVAIMKCGILIQCRLSSKRFPAKVLQKVYREHSLLEIIYTSLSKYLPNYLQANGIDSESIPVYFIIPADEPDLARFMRDKDLPYMTGHPENVLLRYECCAHQLGLDKIVRITADNPFYNLASVAGVIRTIMREDLDYFAWRGLLLGTAAEAFSLRSLVKCLNDYRHLLTAEDYEHVSTFLKKNPALFRFKIDDLSPAPESDLWNPAGIRLTVDYPQDLDFIRSIVERLENPFDASNLELIQVCGRGANDAVSENF